MQLINMIMFIQECKIFNNIYRIILIDEKWNFFSDDDINKNIQFPQAHSSFVYNLFYKKLVIK